LGERLALAEEDMRKELMVNSTEVADNEGLAGEGIQPDEKRTVPPGNRRG